MKKYFTLGCCLVGILNVLFFAPVEARTYGVYSVELARTYRGARTTSSAQTTRHSTIPNIRVGRNYAGRSRDVLFGRFYADNRVTYRADGIFLVVASGTFVHDKNGNGQNTDAEDLSEVFRDFKLYINNQYVDYQPDFSVYRGRVGVWFDTEVILEPNSQIMLVGEISRSAESGDKIRFDLRREGIIGAEVW